MRSSERAVQRAVLAYLAAAAPQVLVAHVPNGGARDVREAAQLRADGVRAGFPDLILCTPGGRIGFWEVKTAAGRLSRAQTAMIERLRGMGFRCAVIRSVEDAHEELTRGLGVAARTRLAA